jgi:chromosome segregation ATPase
LDLPRKCFSSSNLIFSHLLGLPSVTQDNEKFREKAAKKKEELTQAELASQGPDDEELAKRTKLEELTREAQEQSRMKHDLEADVKRATEPQKALERKLKFLNKEMKGAEVNLRSASKRLQDKREEILARAGSAQSEEARRTQRLKEAEDNQASARQKYDENKQAVTDALREYEQLEPHVEQAKQNCNAAKNRLNAVEYRIRDLGNSNSSSVAMFGQKCASVKKNVRIRRLVFLLGDHHPYTSSLCTMNRWTNLVEMDVSKDLFLVPLEPT